MSKTLLEILTLADLAETESNEPEIITIQINNRLNKFLVCERHDCQHQDGRFGMLLILKKPKGVIYYEAFQTPQGVVEFLDESPEQDPAIKSHWTKPCRPCKAKGYEYDRVFERNEPCSKCNGQGYIKTEPPTRKVTLL